MIIFCFNDIKTIHLENRLLEKYLVSYWFDNLKLFHPDWTNFDQTDTFEIIYFSISPMPVTDYYAKVASGSEWPNLKVYYTCLILN